MAYYKIEKNTKGLFAKIQVHSKNLETGGHKLVTKRIYNTDNLSRTKFEKLIEKEAIDLEANVEEAYNKATGKIRNKVLTFDELSKEFLTNIRTNLSLNYYRRSKEIVEKFNAYLQENNLNREPINSITIRDIQMFFNSCQTYEKLSGGMVRLRTELPKTINWRLMAREKIIDRCLSYEFRMGKRNLSKIKAIKLCNYYKLNFNKYFIEVPNTVHYAMETLKGYRRVLRAIFNEAVRYEWITRNPVSQTKIGAGSGNVSLRPVNEKEVFSIQEAKDFISTIDQMDDSLIYKKIALKFLILTGVRIAEMNGLLWSDIDFEKKVVHIVRSKQYHKEVGIYIKEPKTKTSVRDIPLNDALINDLRKYQKWFRLIDNNFDNNLDQYSLAVNMYREPVSIYTIGVWLRKFESEHGFKHVSCHGLRHTYCSLLLAHNVPIQTVSRYMGHSDSTITLKVYSHFIPDTQDKVLNALDNLT